MIRRVRLRSFFLGVLFFAGALGAPIADALVFHHAGSDPLAGVVHLEGADAGHHAERCILGQPGIARRSVPDVPTGLVRAAPIRSTPTAPTVACAPATTTRSLPHSRAPPHAI